MIPAPPRSLAILAAALPGLWAAGACRDAGQDGARVEAVAWVNGTPIGLDALGRELAFARRSSAGLVPQTEEGLAVFRRGVLEELIDRALVLAAAREAGISIQPEEVDREILRLKAEYHGASFDETLAESQMTQQELRERTRARLAVEKLFVDKVFSRQAVTEKEIGEYLAAHPEELARPEQVRAAQIVVKTADEAKRVQAELRKGVSFDEVARRFSISPDAKVGGDLGYFPRGVMPEVFDQSCFPLAPGRVSEVVPSAFGFHLFKVLDHRPPEQVTSSVARGEVEKKLLRQKKEDAQRRTMAELRAKAQIKLDEVLLSRVRF